MNKFRNWKPTRQANFVRHIERSIGFSRIGTELKDLTRWNRSVRFNRLRVTTDLNLAYIRSCDVSLTRIFKSTLTSYA